MHITNFNEIVGKLRTIRVDKEIKHSNNFGNVVSIEMAHILIISVYVKCCTTRYVGFHYKSYEL